MKATVQILTFMSSSLGANAFVNDMKDANLSLICGRRLGLDSSSLALDPESTAYSNTFLQIPIFETAHKIFKNSTEHELKPSSSGDCCSH